MNGDRQDKLTASISATVEDLYIVEALVDRHENIQLSLTSRRDPSRSKKLLEDRLELAGYVFELMERDGFLLLTVDPKRKLRIPKKNIILFVLTLFTVYVVPVFLRNLAEPDIFRATVDDLARGEGVEFTLALMSILLVHEMGHFIAGRRRNIITSWPYFIPAPNIIGTFGAIIRSRSPFWNRRDLIEVGAAGPIAGWIVAVGWLLYGLSQSIYLPAELIPLGELSFTLEGESLLMRTATLAIIGPAPAEHFYLLTEAAFAGWVGLLVTAINLLPMGQLDGGHILYGLVRRRQHLLGRITLMALIFLGFFSITWWLFAALGLFFGVKHPPTLQDSRPPSTAAFAMGLVAIGIMILSFTPIPFPSPFPLPGFFPGGN